jgi:hypothetical protein
VQNCLVGTGKLFIHAQIVFVDELARRNAMSSSLSASVTSDR